MKNQEKFEWSKFRDLGIEYLDEDNPAKQRTGVSRFYYSAFCSSRDFLNENKTYLDKKSEKIMTSKNVDVHRETSKIFKNHPKFKKDNKGKIISKNLNKLRKMRNQADYDNSGLLYGDINWDYNDLTSVLVFPLNNNDLSLENGTFAI